MPPLDPEARLVLYVLFLLVAAPAALGSMIVGHRGGYESKSLALTCSRAWATATKWFVLLAIVTVGLLFAIGLIRNWNLEILGHFVPYVSRFVLIIVALYLPITVISSFVFYYFGARKRTREALAGMVPDPDPRDPS